MVDDGKCHNRYSNVCVRCKVKLVIRLQLNGRYWQAVCPQCGFSVSYCSSSKVAQENWNAKMEIQRYEELEKTCLTLMNF